MLSVILSMAVVAQVDEALELAKKGATMGGQALLVAFLIVMGWIIRSMHNDNKRQISSALEAGERQHKDLLGMLTTEREDGKKERDSNHETLVRIATESATGLQATAAAINGSTMAMNSLRETMHAMRGDMYERQLKRDGA